MNRDFVLRAAWHGFRGAVLAAATAQGFIGQRMPTNYEWIGIASVALVGFVNGADSYRADPGGKA